MKVLKDYYAQIAGIILAFGFAFTLLGVYDTHTLPFYMRLTFWTVTMATGIITTFLLMPAIVNKWLRDYPPTLQVLLCAILASFPVTFVLTFFNPTFGLDSSLIRWGWQFGYVLVVSIIVGIVNYPFMKWAGIFGPDEDMDVTQAGDHPVSQFLQRLPRKYHEADLYGFSAEDHYLRVYTDRGEDLILLRFADAKKELSDVEGLQVHRSWWVMCDGVSESRREKGKPVLILKSGVSVPVSRTYLDAAREAFKL